MRGDNESPWNMPHKLDMLEFDIVPSAWCRWTCDCQNGMSVSTKLHLTGETMYNLSNHCIQECGALSYAFWWEDSFTNQML
eukprot:9386473-Ditylum_brightwellii.AAC.1